MWEVSQGGAGGWGLAPVGTSRNGDPGPATHHHSVGPSRCATPDRHLPPLGKLPGDDHVFLAMLDVGICQTLSHHQRSWLSPPLQPITTAIPPSLLSATCSAPPCPRIPNHEPQTGDCITMSPVEVEMGQANHERTILLMGMNPLHLRSVPGVFVHRL